MSRPRTFKNTEVIEVMESHQDAFVTASEIAEEIGVTSTAITTRLNELEEEGRVDKKEMGGNTIAWWPTGQLTPASY